MKSSFYQNNVFEMLILVANQLTAPKILSQWIILWFTPEDLLSLYHMISL
jgi:hypothetical protein